MGKEGEKRVLVDFPAKLILLRGRDRLGYPKVQPQIETFVISHRWRPQGGFHARAFRGRSQVRDFGTFSDSFVRYVQTNPRRATHVKSPATAATASIAPTEFVSFTGLKAYRDRATGDLLIETAWEGRLSLVFWKRGASPLSYEPIRSEGTTI